MDKLFAHIQTFDGDFFVADYAEVSKTNATYKGKGVEVTDSSPAIDCLTFMNSKKVEAKVVNFEKNLSAFRVSPSEIVSQCECACFSTSNDRPWLAFAELKYCMQKNTSKNAKKALGQLNVTHDYLVSKCGDISWEQYHTYYIVSIPEHDCKAPFCASFFTQDDRLDLKLNKGVTLIDYNRVEIINGQRLRAAK